MGSPWANAEETIFDLVWRQEAEFTVQDVVTATTYTYETCATVLRGIRKRVRQRDGVKKRLVFEKRGRLVYRWEAA